MYDEKRFSKAVAASVFHLFAAISVQFGARALVLRQRQRWTRRWYLLVIVLLYIGLLASFSLNVSLLLRKPAASVTRAVTSEDGTPDSSSATAASVTGDETSGDISDKQGRTGFF